MISTPFVYGFCAGFFVAELLLVWIFRALPPKTATPPNAAPEPHLEQHYDIATVAPKSIRIVGAVRVPIHHNTQHGAQN